MKERTNIIGSLTTATQLYFNSNVLAKIKLAIWKNVPFGIFSFSANLYNLLNSLNSRVTLVSRIKCTITHQPTMLSQINLPKIFL